MSAIAYSNKNYNDFAGAVLSAATFAVVRWNPYVAIPAFIASFATSWLDAAVTPLINKAYPTRATDKEFAHTAVKTALITYVSAHTVVPLLNAALSPWLGVAMTVNVLGTVVLSLIGHYFFDAVNKGEMRPYWFIPAHAWTHLVGHFYRLCV